MRIHYMRAYFWSPYLSHITRSTCIYFVGFPTLNLFFFICHHRVFCSNLTKLRRNFRVFALFVVLQETRKNDKVILERISTVFDFFQIGKCFRHPFQFGFPHDHRRRDYFYCKLTSNTLCFRYLDLSLG